MNEIELQAELGKARKERASAAAIEIEAILKKHRCVLIGDLVPTKTPAGQYAGSIKINVVANE